MLGILDPAEKHDWKSEVSPSVHAYNCTKHDNIGYSPYFLMFGRKPNLAVMWYLDLLQEMSIIKIALSILHNWRIIWIEPKSKLAAVQKHHKELYDRSGVVLVKIVAMKVNAGLLINWKKILTLSRDNQMIIFLQDYQYNIDHSAIRWNLTKTDLTHESSCSSRSTFYQLTHRRWWLMFYGHFCAQGGLNGSSAIQI